jgi:Mg-chelatase subunit ChlI
LLDDHVVDLLPIRRQGVNVVEREGISLHIRLASF